MIDPTLLPALDAIEKALQPRPIRHYAPPPEVDYREEEPAEPRSAEQFFLEEQCPSDRAFR